MSASHMFGSAESNNQEVIPNSFSEGNKVIAPKVAWGEDICTLVVLAQFWTETREYMPGGLPLIAVPCAKELLPLRLDEYAAPGFHALQKKGLFSGGFQNLR